MSDKPKFEVIDRRKMKAEEEKGSAATPAPVPPSDPAPAPASNEPAPGPRLVVSESQPEAASQSKADDLAEPTGLPPAPTAEQSREQKAAYEASAEHLENLIRAQNPSVGPQPPVGFEHLVQQLYLSAMIQMGAGAQEGQRPRVDIVGARQTIDLLGVLAEKTRGNLSALEQQLLDSALFEVRMAFLEITNMITLQGPVPPPAAK